MDFLYNKLVKYFRNILNHEKRDSNDSNLNITFIRDGSDTLVKQGKFFNNRCAG